MKFWALFSGMIVGILAAGTVSAVTISLAKEEGEIYSATKIIGLDRIVGLEYFKESDFDDRANGLYAGYVAALDDPNTRYLTVEQKEDYEKAKQGIQQGVGIKFTWGITNQYLVITDVQKDSPAKLANINVGDRIVQLDDTLAMASNEMDIYKKLTTTSEQPVIYHIQKPDGTIEQIPLVVAQMQLPITTSQILDDNIGYIEVNNFSSWFEILDAPKLIFDLRYVTDVSLDEVLWFCDLFLDEGEIFTTIDKDGDTVSYNATPGKLSQDVAILTNNLTQGIIEAAVAKLKPLENVYIVGNETNGAITVNELIELSDGSAVLVSTNKINVDGVEISNSPIEPEYEEKQSEAYTLEIVSSGRKDLDKDTQLQKAIELIK
ncbi:hypothetical protein AN642_01775 [Epulopiscium sp. SCG-B10WGA-EpuloA2]|nr:hypothetical protein AN642_01775 [Epulopiscium sp. SCG-B10WGA-EpuloA2]